jgi:hypothetical protein
MENRKKRLTKINLKIGIPQLGQLFGLANLADQKNQMVASKNFVI